MPANKSAIRCYITPARKRRAIRRLREWTSGLLGVCGFALLASWACGMDYSIWLRDQVMIWAGGGALIGLAYLVYPARPKRKSALRDGYPTRRTRKYNTIRIPQNGGNVK